MEEKTLSVIDNKRLLLNTVAKGATESEFEMFLEFCRATGLNPYKKEIWFIKTKSGVQMMTGINGFLAIANRHPQFDGMEVSIQEENGKLVSATAKVYRKDRKIPSCATVYLSEYFKPSQFGNGMWEKMPRMMLQKVAKSVALREAFPQELGGMYTQEEMPAEYSLENRKTVKKEITYDLSRYEFQEKVPGIIDAYKSKGYKVDGVILHIDREVPQLKSCEVKDLDFETVSPEIEEAWNDKN